MVKISIKVDWMNLRVEFSPNIKVIDANTENDKTVFLLDTEANYSEDEYPVFILSKEKVENEEPFDDEDRFWKDFINPPGVAESSISNIPAAPSSISSSKMEKPLQSSIESPQPSVATVSDSQLEDPKAIEKRKIESQMATIQKMIAKLDADFQAGLVPQDQYIKKKGFLAEKLGALMGKLEQL
ncbi:MAG: hypothetical protein ACTSRZ_08975 [Promethearchaeota archaeon]